MNRDKIEELLHTLDKEVPEENAMLRIHKQIKPYGNVLLGTRNGLLRFGIHAMRKGLSIDTRSNEVDRFEGTELDYLQGDELEPYQFQRNDKVEKLTLEQSQRQTRSKFDTSTRFWIFGYISILSVFVAIGVYTSIGWLASFFGR
jgi:hypothetical protein